MCANTILTMIEIGTIIIDETSFLLHFISIKIYMTIEYFEENINNNIIMKNRRNFIRNN